MGLGQIIESGSTVIVAGVAVVMAVAWFRDRDSQPQQVTYESASVVDGWEGYNERSPQTGATDAPVVITEFMDFECPYCGRLAPVIDSVLAAFPDDVTLVFHHFPLEMHQHARTAAIAAECADRQQRFWPMYDALLSGQESLGMASWESFAEEAGVTDIPAFSESQCTNCFA